MDRKLTELLCGDRSSREFFAGLSPELRRLLMERDIGNFKALKRAADECGGRTFAADRADVGKAASASECTGAVPQGSDMSCEKRSSIESVTP